MVGKEWKAMGEEEREEYRERYRKEKEEFEEKVVRVERRLVEEEFGKEEE
jgi:hypothetical protein